MMWLIIALGLLIWFAVTLIVMLKASGQLPSLAWQLQQIHEILGRMEVAQAKPATLPAANAPSTALPPRRGPKSY